MKKFINAFALSMILLAGLCGFAAVDLSTEKYMPGQFAVFLKIEAKPGEELALILLGQRYSLNVKALEAPAELLKDFRGLLPAAPRAAWALTGQAVRAAADSISSA
jgi:hypothetical protein